MGLDLVFSIMQSTANRTLVFGISACLVVSSDWGLTWSYLGWDDDAIDCSKTFVVLTLPLVSLLCSPSGTGGVLWGRRIFSVGARSRQKSSSILESSIAVCPTSRPNH